MANNKEIAHQILTAVGGASNLKDATHCMTRLRLYLKDDSIPKDEEVKAIGGVLGVVRGGQQYQVIIGTNVPKVYEELCKLANLTANAPVEDTKAAAEDAAVEGDTIYPAPEKKKVLVAGGGPGGLYAAYTAARRGHQVILCEKDAELGGILKSEQALPFKQEMYQLAGTYANLARKAGVEIRLNTAVTPELVAAEAPDALIIAVGSAPLVPPIPGLKGDNVVVVNNYYKEKDKVTDDVVVFGGGLAGCECAIHLGQEGKRVHLVEMRDVLAPDANVRHRPLLLKEIEKYVTVHTGCKGLEVRPDGILCETKDGEQVLVPGTSVICALGQRSRTADVEALRGTAPFVRIIGDAAKVSTITNAVYWGYHAALDIGAGMD